MVKQVHSDTGITYAIAINILRDHRARSVIE